MNLTLTLFDRPLRLGFAAAIVALSSAPALTTLARAADAQSAQTLAADTPQTTSAGHTFTAASGWTLTRRGSAIIIEAPERDVRIGLVDVQAKDADDAVAQGWAAVNPGFKRPLKLKTPGAARNGWEERHSYQYETSPNEKLVVSAAAWRAGTAWLAIAVEGSESTLEKRGSSLGLMQQSLRPKGYARETFAGRKAHPLDAQRITLMRAFLLDGMRQLGVPGVGFSLIDNGKVVYEGGLGVKKLGSPEPVDADTLFIAASNTKALTTLLLAQAVDDGRLRWDDPVVKAFPRFKLGDEATTKQVQVRHLVCACTGMPRQDLEWLMEYQRATPASTLDLLATMKPTSGFGELFQYSNLMVSAGGYVAAGLMEPGVEFGRAYDDAMQKRVFGPLKMNNTTFDFARAQRSNHASPHGEDVDGQVRVATMGLNYSIVAARPAGGVWTSAHDLSRYVQMELARGNTPDGQRIVSERNLMERRKPQVLVSEDVTYGMGLFVDQRYGTTIVRHGGDLAGYHSDMIWLPEHNVGAVILTNSDPGVMLRGPFLRRLLELLFDGKPEAEEQLRVAAQQSKAQTAKDRERLVLPADPAQARALAARYRNARLGEIAVRRDAKGLSFDVGEWRSSVASRRNDDGSISFITVSPSLNGFEFVAAERDGRKALVLRDAQHEYVFIAS